MRLYTLKTLIIVLAVADIFFKINLISYLSFTAFIVYVLKEMKFNSTQLLFFAYPLWFFVGVFIGGLLLINGAYMTEAAVFGFNNGLIGWSVLYFLLVWSVYKFGFSIKIIGFSESYSVKQLNNKIIVYSVNLFIVGLIVFFLIFYSSPIIKGVNRVAFFNSLPGPVEYIKPIIYILVFFPIYYFIYEKKSLFNFLCLIIIIVSIHIVLGEKLTGFIRLFPIIFILFAARETSIQVKKKHILFLMLFGMLLFLLVLYTYNLMDVNPFLHFYNRIALQAQVPWFLINDLQAWFNGIYSNFSITDIKIDKVPYRYMPLYFYLRHTEAGFILTSFFPAVLYLKYGIVVGTFIIIITSFFIGLLGRFMLMQLRNRNMILSFFTFFAFNTCVYFLFNASVPGLVSIAIIILFLIAASPYFIFGRK